MSENFIQAMSFRRPVRLSLFMGEGTVMDFDVVNLSMNFKGETIEMLTIGGRQVIQIPNQEIVLHCHLHGGVIRSEQESLPSREEPVSSSRIKEIIERALNW